MTRKLVTGLAIVLAVAGNQLLGAPAAPAATVALTPLTWDVNRATASVTYSMVLHVSGLRTDTLPCGGSPCAYDVQALYRDGEIDRVEHLLARGSYRGPAGWFSHTEAAEGAPLAEVTHLRARVWPSTGTITDGYETVIPVAVTVRLNDEEREALAAFAPDFEFSYDAHTGVLVGGTLVPLADAVCRAAETEILRGGQAKGPQFANGTLLIVQVSLQNLCLGLAAAGVTVTIPPWLPGYDPLDAATWPEPVLDATPDASYQDGPGDSGN